MKSSYLFLLFGPFVGSFREYSSAFQVGLSDFKVLIQFSTNAVFSMVHLIAKTFSLHGEGVPKCKSTSASREREKSFAVFACVRVLCCQH